MEEYTEGWRVKKGVEGVLDRQREQEKSERDEGMDRKGKPEVLVVRKVEL